ncbi:SRPBCC family protein [Streptomyces sp. NPDC059002]|uniref:SRPBCC family protein n=1 Tax=Streptomyces sp. NPDC059002 TaxID=3346690 RepID=UPI00367C685A
MRHAVTMAIDAPADQVWRTVRDVERWPDWTPTVTGVRLHGGGDIEQGSVVTVHQPKQPVREWTVTELVDGTSFTWVSRSPGLRLAAGHVVRSAGGPTTVELTFSVAGPLAPVAKLLAGKAIRLAVDTEAASLKKWCENTSS